MEYSKWTCGRSEWSELVTGMAVMANDGWSLQGAQLRFTKHWQ